VSANEFKDFNDTTVHSMPLKQYWNSKLLNKYAMHLALSKKGNRWLTITEAKTRDAVILIKIWQRSSYYWNCLFIRIQRIPKVMQALMMERPRAGPLIAFGKINAYNKVGRFQTSLHKSFRNLHKLCDQVLLFLFLVLEANTSNSQMNSMFKNTEGKTLVFL